MHGQMFDLSNIDSYRQIFDAMPIHIYMKDINFNYVYCNLLQAKYLGLLNRENIVDKNDYDFLPKTLADVIRVNDELVVKSCKPMLFEESLVDCKNVERYFISNKVPVLDQKENVTGIMGFSFDVTEMKIKVKKAQFEKEEIEYTLKYIINNLPGHVYWKDINLLFKGCNVQQAKSAGLEYPSQLIGKNDFDMPWKNDAEKLREVDLLVMSSKNDITKEEIWQSDETGETFTFLSKKTPLLNKHGDVVGLIGISLDITDRKKMEEELHLAKEKAEVASQAKSDFISNMQHDLRTPVSGIGGMANLLYDMYKDKYPELNEYLEIMIKSCNQWENVQNRIFDVLDVEQMTPIKVEPVLISEVLAKIQDMMAATLHVKKIKYVIEPISTRLDNIDSDPFKLFLILSSIISNAINFTEEGEITVRVTHEGDFCVIKVSDTGIGIPSDKFEYIFEKYTKLSRSNKYGGHFKGVGLGLYTANEYAKQLGAKIQVDSTLGEGSSFSIKLPLQTKK